MVKSISRLVRLKLTVSVRCRSVIRRYIRLSFYDRRRPTTDLFVYQRNTGSIQNKCSTTNDRHSGFLDSFYTRNIFIFFFLNNYNTRFNKYTKMSFEARVPVRAIK